MSATAEPKLPSEIFIRIPADRGGRKPFLLNFMERLPSSTEVAATCPQMSRATQTTTTASNDVIDVQED